MAGRRRRTRLGIILDILEALEREGPLPPTRLATAANLPYDRLMTILEELESRGVVELVDDPGQPRARRARLTRKGREALRELRRLRPLLSDLGLA